MYFIPQSRVIFPNQDTLNAFCPSPLLYCRYFMVFIWCLCFYGSEIILLFLSVPSCFLYYPVMTASIRAQDGLKFSLDRLLIFICKFRVRVTVCFKLLVSMGV